MTEGPGARDPARDQSRVKGAALASLARREHSFSELFDKLCTRFPDLDPDWRA